MALAIVESLRVNLERVGRQGFEVVVAVERGGGVVDGVHDDELSVGAASGLDDGVERDHEQLVAEVLAVEMLGEGALGEQDRRDVPRGASARLLRVSRSIVCGATEK